MVNYKCVICSFETSYKTRYTQHCKTKKHIANMNSVDEKINMTPKKCYPMLPECYPNVTRMLPDVTQPMLPECYPNVTQMLPDVTQPNFPEYYPSISQCNLDVTQKKTQCPYCFKVFASRHGKSRHINMGRCKGKKDEQKIELENMKQEVKELKEKNHTLTNNIQNFTKINNQNIGTINYLNIHFSNVQPIEQFIDNLKNKFQLSNTDRKCLLNTYNECGIDAFAETFSIIMKKYQSEQVEKGVIPTMPLVCTDGNLRSFKEYHEDGWKTTQSNSSIDKMIDISNEQIYQSEKTKVFITQKERKKIHNRIKKDNTLTDMEVIRNKYKKSQLNTNILDEDDVPIICLDYQNKKEITEYDFSNINDDYIEKYSKK